MELISHQANSIKRQQMIPKRFLGYLVHRFPFDSLPALPNEVPFETRDNSGPLIRFNVTSQERKAGQ